VAKSLAQIEAQIESLRLQAAALKAKEAKGVIARMKQAIEHYGLTAEDLGLSTSAAVQKGPRPVAAKKAVTRKKGPGKKTIGVLKYSDGAGHAWTGKGTRPNWFKAALAAGKSIEDLTIKSLT
jgi:DNA-binding protein H-NS